MSLTTYMMTTQFLLFLNIEHNNKHVFKKPKNCCNVFAECVDYLYGNTCSDVCGLCKDRKTCDKRNGTCINGCVDYVKGSRCDGK